MPAAATPLPDAVIRLIPYLGKVIEYGAFQRQVRLPVDVDPDGAHARYERGMLTITLPVADKPAPKQGRIAIPVERE